MHELTSNQNSESTSGLENATERIRILLDKTLKSLHFRKHLGIEESKTNSTNDTDNWLDTIVIGSNVESNTPLQAANPEQLKQLWSKKNIDNATTKFPDDEDPNTIRFKLPTHYRQSKSNSGFNCIPATCLNALIALGIEVPGIYNPLSLEQNLTQSEQLIINQMSSIIGKDIYLNNGLVSSETAIKFLSSNKLGISRSVDLSTMLDHLQSGGVIISHIGLHEILISNAYKKDGKVYFVINDPLKEKALELEMGEFLSLTIKNNKNNLFHTILVKKV